jgi:two-component system response regulator MprA
LAILVVDDDQAVRASLYRALTLYGFEVELANSGEDALVKLHANGVETDLLILDVVMPGLDGLALTRRLRADCNKLPILLLSALTQLPDRLEGLEAGADDYMTKPFALEELVARIRALLRRAPADEARVLRFADIELDSGARRVSRDGRLLHLTRTEFALLELFLSNPGEILPRAFIFESVWGYDIANNSKSLDIYITYLRKKTEAYGGTRLIHNMRGIGYALREAEVGDTETA